MSSICARKRGVDGTWAASTLMDGMSLKFGFRSVAGREPHGPYLRCVSDWSHRGLAGSFTQPQPNSRLSGPYIEPNAGLSVKCQSIQAVEGRERASGQGWSWRR